MNDQVASKLKRIATSRAKRGALAANIISSHLVGLPLGSPGGFTVGGKSSLKQ